MSNSFIDLTKLSSDGILSRPSIKLGITDKTLQNASLPSLPPNVPKEFENISYLTPINVNGLNCCYFNDSVDSATDYNYDLGTLLIPKSFQYVDYEIDQTNIDLTKKQSFDKDIFTPVLINLSNDSNVPEHLDHCENHPVVDDGTFKEKWRPEGCMPLKAFSKDKPFLIYYYEGDKNLRLETTTIESDKSVTEANKEKNDKYCYYLIAIQMPAKYFVFYAIPKKEAEGDNGVLGEWLKKIKDQNKEILGIGIEHRLCYNDDLLVFITSKAVIVFKEPTQ